MSGARLGRRKDKSDILINQLFTLKKNIKISDE
jgi:hypothetical protein